MTFINPEIILIGYEEQENIGLRSIMSFLLSRNYSCMLIPYSEDNWQQIRAEALKTKPLVIGFSIIFQYTINNFAGLISYLRDGGVESHFTAGGHFPSVEPQETLSLIPGLDSVVIGEGELTLLELLESLKQRKQLSGINGLAFRKNTGVVINSPRNLIEDLDVLPPIYRSNNFDECIIRSASVLASRGCFYTCSFCSIRKFYGSSKGALRRTRSPQAVVREIEFLHKEKGVSYVVFQDDDFSTRGENQRDWLRSFLKEFKSAGLHNSVKWKISCRVDDVDPGLFENMKSCGLFAVYLGVESGSEEGLKLLNKRASVGSNLEAIERIKELNLILTIGFMLFDPSSTFNSVKDNIKFLYQVSSDGYFPVNFCKMLPYAGTPIHEKLKQQDRLKGTVTEPDYEMSDPNLDWYSFLVKRIFQKRNFDRNGLVRKLQGNELLAKFMLVNGREEFLKALTEITRGSNILALDTLSELLLLFENENIPDLFANDERLVNIAEKEWLGEADFLNKLDALERILKTEVDLKAYSC